MTVDAAMIVERVRSRIASEGARSPRVLGVSGDSAYLVSAPLFREMCNGLPAKEAARALARVGALRRNSRGGFKHCIALPFGRSISVYVFEAKPIGLPPNSVASGIWQAV